MGKRKSEAIVVDEWVLPQVEIMTNVGLQITDLKCQLVKHIAAWDVFTLFEKYVLGYRDYWYRIDVEPENPIRHNRDKDYLPGFSDEGNDATHSFSLGMGATRRWELENISREACTNKILVSLQEYDPVVKKQQAKKWRERKEPWTNKTLFSKRWHDEHYNDTAYMSLYTAIYPFHGHDLSGWTDIFSLCLRNDDEDGFGIEIALFGVHFTWLSRTLQKKLLNPFIKHRPVYDRKGMEWSQYYPLLLQWQKDYPFEHMMDSDFRIEIGVNRANGFFFRKELDHSCRTDWSKKFNPWRNKFWNLI
jgi:hypothetical protein